MFLSTLAFVDDLLLESPNPFESALVLFLFTLLLELEVRDFSLCAPAFSAHFEHVDTAAV